MFFYIYFEWIEDLEVELVELLFSLNKTSQTLAIPHSLSSPKFEPQCQSICHYV